MLNNQTTKASVSEFSRCEELKQIIDYRKHLSPAQKSDAYVKEKVCDALWRDEVIRAVEYSEIDVYVFDGIVHLSGHISGTNSLSRIENAMQGISGVLKISNNLVLDDKLTSEVAISLASIGDIFNCKFFIGASHGVVTLNGEVNTLKVKLLAEKRAASNQNVRGVINSIRVSGDKPDLLPEAFLQPVIGETIYFLDWASGIVKQVIINPNDRRVVAMLLYGKFDAKTSNIPEQLVTVPMNTVRYLNGVSGFLHIHSNEKNKYAEFNSAHFVSPNNNWLPPYPYCSEDVLIPIEYQNNKSSAEQLLNEGLLNDSLGG
jgi:osmotically-inducible protein OsmY